MTTAAEALELATAEVAYMIDTGKKRLDFSMGERFHVLEISPSDICARKKNKLLDYDEDE